MHSEAFSITQEHYSGPLALLLELIEEQRLEITQVSLAQVADAFLAYMQTKEVPEEEMAEFLVVAARLIYVKSRELLPYARMHDEEDAVERLEDRLRAYKAFVDAARRLYTEWGSEVAYVRPPLRAPHAQSFRPAQNVHASMLHEAFRGLLRRLEPFFALREQKMTRTVSIEERIRGLREALTARVRIHFHELIGEEHGKEDVVTHFLAVLEMLRRHEVRIVQTEPFAHIMIEKHS